MLPVLACFRLLEYVPSFQNCSSDTVLLQHYVSASYLSRPLSASLYLSSHSNCNKVYSHYTLHLSLPLRICSLFSESSFWHCTFRLFPPLSTSFHLFPPLLPYLVETHCFLPVSLHLSQPVSACLGLPFSAYFNISRPHSASMAGLSFMNHSSLGAICTVYGMSSRRPRV